MAQKIERHDAPNRRTAVFGHGCVTAVPPVSELVPVMSHHHMVYEWR